MKKSGYRITSRAVQDLEEIWSYTYSKWSLKQADRYYQLIIEEFEHLSRFPKSGKPADHIRLGYRIGIVKSHLIFYRQMDVDQIEIARILHQSMDIDERFGA